MKINIFFLAAALAVAALFATSCRKQESGADSNVDYYTCSMHPSVRSHDPKGKCPICGMDLIPVLKKTSGTNQPPMAGKGHDHAKMLAEQSAGKGEMQPESPVEFTVPVLRQQQIGVTYTTAETKPLRQTIRAVGVATYENQRHWDFVARVQGYVQKLFVSSPGEIVEKDQPLLTIYSPDLLTTQREFVSLLAMRDQAEKSGSQAARASAERLIESTRRRLFLWNITTNQIAELEKSRELQEALTIQSPFRGVVHHILTGQGKNVNMGDELIDLADLSVVWVWAEFYQNEASLMKINLPVTVTSASYPGEKFAGKIAVVDPFLDESKRTTRVRIDVENPDLKLRADMFVDVELELGSGEGLAVPVSAVMPTGKRNIVFVNKGEGKLEPRFVELGKKFGGDYAINSGLTNGERVVNSANFLIDAEAKVQGALKSW